MTETRNLSSIACRREQTLPSTIEILRNICSIFIIGSHSSYFISDLLLVYVPEYIHKFLIKFYKKMLFF